jgi:type IV secretory pathway ATPase VirB11/archaellum biosynthesis ATPase
MAKTLRIRASGPLQVAEFDCHGCEGNSTLADARCRTCVFGGLGMEGAIDRVVLKKSYHRVYDSPEPSNLARTLASIKQLAHDRALYAAGEGGKCKECVSSRMKEITETWPRLLENPHDLSSFVELGEKEKNLCSECANCTAEHFSKLINSIKEGLISLKTNYPSRTNDNELFTGRSMPFFVEGVWHPPKFLTKLIDSYTLPERRGEVRIYEQADRPVNFYELDLPEFRLSSEQLGLLEDAFRLEIKEAPGHARFANPTRIASFSQDWYNSLLHIARERSNVRISSAELKELAKKMASWLTYRVLEPLSYDDHITDIYIPAPPEVQPIYIVHDKWETCETGIYWTTPALVGMGETLASRLGTAFDEVRPQLDVEIPELGMRLFLSRYPAMWPQSVSISIRKRRKHAWTQPLFIERGTLTPLASSFISNIIRTGASAFVIGEKGSAKTSQIETLIPEIGPNYRIISYQDTEELHLEEFIKYGYKLENVRIADPEHLQRQIDAFLRGGEAYWLITEVRAIEAVKAALGAAARQGSQPLITSFHVKTKREMYDLICHIMGLHEAAYKYIDLVISTARFSTPAGSIRRITEITEVLKDWTGNPEYVELFKDDRKHDLLAPAKFLVGNKHLINQLNSDDLSRINVVTATKRVEFLPPERGGSCYIPAACERLAIEEKDFLASILTEAKIKSDLLALNRQNINGGYLELPFVSKAYNFYFALLKKYAPDYTQVLEDWHTWIKVQ